MTISKCLISFKRVRAEAAEKRLLDMSGGVNDVDSRQEEIKKSGCLCARICAETKLFPPPGPSISVTLISALIVHLMIPHIGQESEPRLSFDSGSHQWYPDVDVDSRSIASSHHRSYGLLDPSTYGLERRPLLNSDPWDRRRQRRQGSRCGDGRGDACGHVGGASRGRCVSSSSGRRIAGIGSRGGARMAMF